MPERSWFLSYHSRDQALAERLASAMTRHAAGERVFFAGKSLRAGGYWQPVLAQEIARAKAFVLLVGEHGLGPWQILEYYEALDRRVTAPDFPLVLVLLAGQTAPGLPFLRQLHWIVTADPASEQSLAQLFDAAAGAGARPGELWRHTSPYRGLAAMTEVDSDFFFGRERETVEVIELLAASSDRLPVLLGNSGVGKSSLAQAGVLAALKRRAFPAAGAATPAWPAAFGDSRRWCFLKLNPGADPLRALVDPFLNTWQYDATDPGWEGRRNGWVQNLLDGQSSLSGLLDATERRYQELGQPKPAAFFLYIDQGEELYVRSEERRSRRFSELVARGLADERLRALISLRADFVGALHRDEALYGVHRKVDVPPLREAELREVVSQPAAVLAARFETDMLPADIARRTAEESGKDAGALPLLSYLLDDMWVQMVRRGDGVLRLPAQAMEVGGVLAERANAFLARNPAALDSLRRMLTLKLATVREDGEPTRRRALRSEFTDDEWRLVSELADHPNRLLVTANPEGGEAYAEVAHEAIFRRWDRLRDWISAQREFLIWRSGMEADRRRWEAAPAGSKDAALLRGLALAQATGWLYASADALSPVDRSFIKQSAEREQREQRQKEALRRRVLAGGIAALVCVTVLAVVSFWQWRQAVRHEQAARQERNRTEQALVTTTETTNALALDMVRSFRGHQLPEEVLDRLLGRAIAGYDKAIASNPNAYYFLGRGVVHYHRQDYDRAILDFDEAAKLKSDANVYLNRALVFIARQEFDRAILDLDRAIALDPDNAQAYYYRGYIYRNRGESRLGFVDDNKAIELDPKLVSACDRRASGQGTLKRIVLRSAGIRAELTKTTTGGWEWLENNYTFRFRSVFETGSEMLIHDASRDMYHCFDFTLWREFWRIGTLGRWNNHYEIATIE